MTMQQNQVYVFLFYALKDKELAENLLKHLKPLERKGDILIWHNHMIGGGNDPSRVIDQQLKKASLILFLVSSNLLESKESDDVVERALKRHDSNQAHVIPILIKPVDWDTTPFVNLSRLPDDGHAVSELRNRDVAFVGIVQGIRRVIEGMTGNSTPRTEDSADNSLPVPPLQQVNRTTSQVSGVHVNSPGSQDKVTTGGQTSKNSPEEVAPRTNRSDLSSSTTGILGGENPFLRRRNLLIVVGATAGIASIGAVSYFVSHFSVSSPSKSRSSSPTNTNSTPSSVTSTNSSPPSGKSSSAASWTSFGYNAQNTRYNDQEHNLRPPSKEKRWSLSTRDSIEGSAAFVDDVAYVNSFDGSFYAIKNKEILWSYDTSQDVALASPESRLNCSSPAVANGIVYFGSRNGYMYALDAKNGNVKGKQKTGGPIQASPMVVNGIVYIVSFDGKIYAFDALLRKQTQEPAPVGGDRYMASPAVDGDSIYIASQDNHVYALYWLC